MTLSTIEKIPSEFDPIIVALEKGDGAKAQELLLSKLEDAKGNVRRTGMLTRYYFRLLLRAKTQNEDTVRSVLSELCVRSAKPLDLQECFIECGTFLLSEYRARNITTGQLLANSLRQASRHTRQALQARVNESILMAFPR